MIEKRHFKLNPSRLDAYADKIDQWFGVEKRSIKYVKEQLAALGCSITRSPISRWWKRRHEERRYENLLNGITADARGRAKKRAVRFDLLIEFHKQLIYDLQKNGDINPDRLRQADKMMRTVMAFMSGRDKLDLERKRLRLEERRVVLLEQKAAAYDRAQRTIKKSRTRGLTETTLRKIERELNLF